MAEIQTRPTTASVDAFIAAQPDAQRRADCQMLVELMEQATGDPAVTRGCSSGALSDVDVDVLRQIIERAAAQMAPHRLPSKVIA